MAIEIKPDLFGKFERFTAGVCMAIPVLLIIAELNVDLKKILLLALVILFVLLLPVFTPWMLKQAEARNHGRYITIAGIAMLVLFWILCAQFELSNKKSISAYVTMTDSNIFGMLLAIAAMLFMTNGFVFWNEERLEDAKVRKWLNAALGILLLGVIIFRCDRINEIHLSFAIPFFALCVGGTVRRQKGDGPKKPADQTQEQKAKRRAHLFWDFAPVFVMVVAVVLWLLETYEIWINPFGVSFTLFGVESIALWIVGVDFILMSMKREPKKEPQ